MSNEGALKNVTKEMLEELYWGQRLNSRQIGEMFGVTPEAIQYQLRKYGIPARDIHECHRGIGLGHPCYFNRTGIEHSDETRHKISIANTGQPSPMRGRRGWSHGLTKETHPSLAKMADKLKGENNPNFGRPPGEHNPMSGKHQSEATKRKIGDAQRGPLNHAFGKILSDEHKAFLRQKSLELAKDPTYIAKLRQKALELWQDPKWVKRMMQARQVKPNKLEQQLIDILAEHLPEYEYNGDFSQGITLGGLIPDFVNTNGKKKVIELFGSFFHTGDRAPDWKRTELGKIMVYNSLGYDCLIIWDYELKDQITVLQKIKAFDRRRR